MTAVKDVMMIEVTAVGISTPAVEVAQRMKTSGVGTIPVCENGKFRGIITERDIVIGIVAASRHSVPTPAGAVMNRDWATISPNDDIWHAVNVTVDRGIKVLPVVQDGKLVGLLSLDDLKRKSPALAAMIFSRSIKPQADNPALYVRRR